MTKSYQTILECKGGGGGGLDTHTHAQMDIGTYRLNVPIGLLNETHNTQNCRLKPCRDYFSKEFSYKELNLAGQDAMAEI